MSEYLKMVWSGIGRTVLQIPTIGDLPKAERGGFRADACRLGHDLRTTGVALRKKCNEVKVGK